MTLAVVGITVVVLSVRLHDNNALPPGFRREVRHLLGYQSGSAWRRWVAERFHDFSVRRPGRGETSLRLDEATMCWGYSNPTSGWFAFGDLVGKSNLFYWELALPKAATLTAALEELPSVTFHGLDSNYWAIQVGSNNVDFNPRAVGHGAIRLETNRIVFTRHTEKTNLVKVVRLKNFRERAWGDVVAEFDIGSAHLEPKDAR